MTLEKIFQHQSCESIQKLIKKHNPFKTTDDLFTAAGISKTEMKEFQKNPDNISMKSLNRLLSLCEFDLKLTAVFGEDRQELEINEEITEVWSETEYEWEEEEEEEEWAEELEEEMYFH
jgi:hypothetical protein